jgi:putative ABC transport system substrate-binding protein
MLAPELGADMRRREFIILFGGAATAAWPLAARAQQTLPVIGLLGSETADWYVDRLRAFREGLGETGHIEGRNVMIDYRWAEGRNDRLPPLAAELVQQHVAVIATLGNTAATLAAKAATATIPIVFRIAADPVEVGLVASLARPGGNLTGVTTLGVEVGPKQLELLHEVVPAVTVVALLINPTNPALAETQSRVLPTAASSLGLSLHILNASTDRDFDAVFASLAQLRAGALVIGVDAFFNSRSDQLAGAGSPPRGAHHLRLSGVHCRRRPDELRRQHCSLVASGRRLRRPNSQWRKARRLARDAVHQSEPDHQPQDREGTRP